MDDIAGYERTYRGSAEEERDLKDYFARFGGDMNQCVPQTPAHIAFGVCADAQRLPGGLRVFDWLCCSRPDVDSHRFLETLRQAIESGVSGRCTLLCVTLSACLCQES